MKNNQPESFQRSRTFTLVKSLASDTGEIKEAIVKPLTAMAAAELNLPPLSEISLEQQEALVVQSADIDSDALQSVTKMDFNTLFEAAWEYYSLTAYDLAGKSIDAKSQTLKLFFQDSEPLHFDFPTLKVSKLAAKVQGDVKRAMFIISQITDLDEEDIQQMAQPDYLSAVEMTSDFLHGMADFFQ